MQKNFKLKAGETNFDLHANSPILEIKIYVPQPQYYYVRSFDHHIIKILMC